MFSPCMRGFLPGTQISFHSSFHRIRSTGYWKLPIGEHGSVNGCPVMKWCPIHRLPRHLKSAGIDSSIPATCNGKEVKTMTDVQFIICLRIVSMITQIFPKYFINTEYLI